MDFLYKALTWKKKYIYSFHLAKLRYEVGSYVVREHILSVAMTFLLYFTVIQIYNSLILFFFLNISESCCSKLKTGNSNPGPLHH